MENIPGFDTLSSMSNEQLTKLFGVRDFFVYEIDFAGLAPAGVASGSFTVQADSNFLWQYGVQFSDIAAAGETESSAVLPLVTATIQDSSSGRQLMNAAVPIPAIFGSGRYPFPLPTPRFFRSQTTVTVAVTNYDAANTYNVRLQFIGTKFFKFAQAL